MSHARNLHFNTRFGAEQSHIQLQMSQFHIPSALALEQKGKAGQELLSAFLAGGLLIKYLNYYSRLEAALQSRAVLALESTGSWDLFLEQKE